MRNVGLILLGLLLFSVAANADSRPVTLAPVVAGNGLGGETLFGFSPRSAAIINLFEYCKAVGHPRAKSPLP